MTKLWIGLAIAAVITGGKLMSNHATMPDTLQGREDFIAEGINRTAPVPVGPYYTLTGAKVSGGTLELQTSMSPTAPRVSIDASFAHGVVRAACKDPTFSDLLKRGGSVRFVLTTADGNVLEPVTVSSSDCPTL